jgi:hypothetical protein
VSEYRAGDVLRDRYGNSMRLSMQPVARSTALVVLARLLFTYLAARAELRALEGASQCGN